MSRIVKFYIIKCIIFIIYVHRIIYLAVIYFLIKDFGLNSDQIESTKESCFSLTSTIIILFELICHSQRRNK